jgi:hypothetical protein
MEKIEERWVNAARAFSEAQAACDPEARRMMLKIRQGMDRTGSNPVLFGGETERHGLASRPYSERN